MDTILTWAAAAGLTWILVVSYRRDQPDRVAAGVFGSFGIQEWGLFIAAVLFLIAAIIGTVGALL